MNNLYYYIKPWMAQAPLKPDGTRGYPVSRALSKSWKATTDRNKWVVFTQDEKDRMESMDIRPYWAKFDWVFSKASL